MLLPQCIERCHLEIAKFGTNLQKIAPKNKSDVYGFLRLPYLSCFNSKPRACVFCMLGKIQLGMPSLLFRQASMLGQIHLGPRTRKSFKTSISSLSSHESINHPSRDLGQQTLLSEMVQRCQMQSSLQMYGLKISSKFSNAPNSASPVRISAKGPDPSTA